jgi:hypothetical protein
MKTTNKQINELANYLYNKESRNGLFYADYNKCYIQALNQLLNN